MVPASPCTGAPTRATDSVSAQASTMGAEPWIVAEIAGASSS